MTSTFLKALVPIFLLTTAATATPRQAPALSTHSRPPIDASTRSLCSDDGSVCVHGKVSASELRRTTSELHQIATSLRQSGWQPPRSDFDLGPTPGFDLFLSSAPWTREPWATRFASTIPDVFPNAAGLRGVSAWGWMHAGIGNPCLRRTTIAQTYFRAVLYGMDETFDSALAEGAAAYVGYTFCPCVIEYIEPLRTFQQHPHWGVLPPPGAAVSRASILLPWFLETQRSSAQPLVLLRALWTLAEDVDPTGISHPDETENNFLNVVPLAQGHKSVSPGDIWLELAVTRAFVGGSSPDSSTLGLSSNEDLSLAVTHDWDFDVSSLPRRLLFPPIRPTGSAYVGVDLSSKSNDPTRKDVSVLVHAEWEPSAIFRFAFLLFDDTGHVVQSRFPPTVVTEPSLTLKMSDIGSYRRLLMVAANVGYARHPKTMAPSQVQSDPGAGLVVTFYREK